MVKIEMDHHRYFFNLQSLYFKLLYDESSEETQLACVEVIRRILGHTAPDILVRTRSQWIECLRYLLLHVNIDVRVAFCAQIGIFVQHPIVSCLFAGEDAMEKSCGRNFLNLIEHSSATAKDLPVIQTLLETTAEFMVAVNVTSEVNKSGMLHPCERGICNATFQSCSYPNELFDNISVRLTSRPNVVREFAEAVLGVETEELVRKMAPDVLPKLLEYWHENSQASNTLNELAKLLGAVMVPLIVNWLPRVLAFALNQKEDENLPSVLQLYHSQIGSDNQENFAAALPAPLDEYVLAYLCTLWNL